MRFATLSFSLALVAACGGSAPNGSGSTAPAADAGAAAPGAPDAGGPVAGIVAITLSQTDVHIPVGAMTAFAVTATHSDGSRSDVTQEAQATSSNPSVATVAHGQGSQIQITGVSAGTATVTVKFGSLQQTAAVTVSQYR